MAGKSVTTMVRSAAALAMVMGLAAVSACGADQTAEQNQAADEAMPAFAPEVAEQPATDYAPTSTPPTS